MTLSPYNIPQQLTSVRLATGNNLIGAYYNGISNNGVGSTLTATSNSSLFVDSTLANVGDRVLLTAQTNSGQNGIYDVVDAGSSISLWKLQRSNDFQSLEQIKLGQFVSVSDGATLKGSMFVIVNPLPSALGVSGLGINFANVASGSGPSGPYLLKSANLSDVQDADTSFTNLGLGSGQILVLSDGDFTGGIYQLTNPCPNYVVLTVNTPGFRVWLPPSSGLGSFALSQGPIIRNNATLTNVSVEIDDAVGNFIRDMDVPSSTHFTLTDKSTFEGSWAQINSVELINLKSGILFLNSGADTVYVSSNSGSDTTGDGTVNFPYATLSNAIASISTASATSPFQILLDPGVYTETNLVIKPWIYINGQGSQITVSGSVTLDVSWSGGGGASFQNFNNVTFPASVSLDFAAAGAPFALYRFSDNVINSAFNFSLIGNPTGTLVSLLGNNFGLSGQISYTVQDSFGSISNGAVQDINIINTSSTSGGNFSVVNVTTLGNTVITTSSTSGSTFFHENAKTIGTVLYQTTGSGNLTVGAKGMTYFSPPELDNGLGGGVVNYSVDFLNALPTLTNGATYTPTSIANAMDANYPTPINFVYPPGDTSVHGAIQGIDNALTGGGGPGISSYGEMFVNGNTRVTSFPSAVFTKIEAGSPLAPTPDFSGYTVGDLQNFTFANGRLTYIGNTTIEVDVVCELTLILSTGTAVEYSVAVAKNGTVLTKTQANVLLQFAVGGAPAPITTSGLISMTTGDYLEVFASNVANTGDTFIARYLDFKANVAGSVAGSVVAPSYGEMYFQGNSALTTFAGANTPTKVNATTYNTGLLDQFTQLNGTLTYTGALPITALVSADLTATYNGTSQNTSFYLALNGSVIPKSKQQVFIGPVTPATITNAAKALVTMNNGDTLELWVENNDNSNSIIVQDLNFSANSITSFAAGSILLAGENYLSLSGSILTANPVNLGTTNVTGILPLNKVADISITINGMSINGSGGVNAGAAVVASQEMRVGNMVTGTILISFNSQVNNNFFTVTKTYGGNFTTATQALGSGICNLDMGASPPVTDGSVCTRVQAIGAFGVRFDTTVTSLSTNYLLEATFSYQVI